MTTFVQFISPFIIGFSLGYLAMDGIKNVSKGVWPGLFGIVIGVTGIIIMVTFKATFTPIF